MNTARIGLCLVVTVLLTSPSRAQVAPSDLDPHQIQWQRSLEDALAISTTEHRPILIAVNVDGESASDRIVDEVYRDPRFVEWTRSFACVVAGPSRHNPRDYDDLGRRIPCPRLGNITCGEHIALEPILYDKYLGGERISPRHALILNDGTKAFDLALQWDWSEIEQKVAEFAASAPAPTALPLLPHKPKELAVDEQRKGQPRNSKKRLGQWRSLAAAHTAFGRDALESTVDGLPSEAMCNEALEAIAEVGDAGSVGVLRILLARTPPPSTALIDRVGTTAATVHVGPALVAALRERMACGRFPGSIGLDNERVLLPLLARFDSAGPATRSFLLAHWAIGSEADRRAAGDAIAPHLERDMPSRCAAAIEDEGGGTQLDELFEFARHVEPVPRPEPAPALTVEQLEAELDASDRALTADKSDVAAQERFGRASLALGYHYAQAGGADPRLNLADAEVWLARAAETKPNDAKLGFDRAKTAWLLGKLEDEERIARASFAGFPARDAIAPPARELVDADGLPDGDVRRAATLLAEEERLEALRWIGDAAARLVPARAGGAPDAEIAGFVRGSRALALVAVSPGSDETDWMSLASFLSIVGLERESLAAWQRGVERLPSSNALRNGLNHALAACGRIDLAPVKADWVAAQNADSGTCAWYAGYAWMLAAEDLRRAAKPDAAIAAYAEARKRFDRSSSLEPKFATSSQHYIGMSALGRGFAHVQAGRLGEAANALVEGLTSALTVLDFRDGLDREVPDLVDALIEWKAGHKSAVDATALAKRLAEATPGSARAVLDVADALLREALRADGRVGATPEAPPGGAVPGEEGDAYMEESIAVARMAVEIDTAGTDGAKARLAQSLTVQAERRIAQADPEAARPLLREAAELMGLGAPAQADAAAWNALAVQLREKLGPARPVFRPGR